MKSLSDQINVGDKIKIMRMNYEDTWFPSQVLDIITDKEFIISGPIKKNNLIFIHKGEEIRLCYMVEDKGKFFFTAKVQSMDHSKVYTLKVQRISDISRIQQREYFRLWSTLEVNKKHWVSKDHMIDEFDERCDARDISGGGMKLYCNFKHTIGDSVSCIIKINSLIIETKAIVKRVDEVDTFDYKYSVGVSFLEMEESNRDAIIKYIFEQQRILRDKGLI